MSEEVCNRIIASVSNLNLKPRLAGNGRVTETEKGWLLSIPAGGVSNYRLAQLDDHLRIQRKDYPWYPPMRLSLEARVSASALTGTWGFGLWNDPYAFNFGPGENSWLRLPALPNAAWFFYSSPVCYLSFRDDRPGNGLLAQLFSSPSFDPLLIRAAITFPFSPRTTRRLLTRIIAEDAVRLDPDPRPNPEADAHVNVDVTRWHSYRLEWTADGTRFYTDDRSVLESSLSPRPPMGIVIWIDNQHAAFTPQGKVTFGMEASNEPSWLEIRNLRAE